ncbi:MAG: flagellar biosynthetic protein FliQ [Actinomycetota bacterium]|nr:flagellar biosynthetic protein FliQ [Actinomycetota bacterium]
MTDSVVIDIAREAFIISAKLAGPILLASLGIGVVVSLIQAVTSIQEMTLTFVPKLIGSALIVLLAGNWMLAEFTAYVQRLWTAIPTLT